MRSRAFWFLPVLLLAVAVPAAADSAVRDVYRAASPAVVFILATDGGTQGAGGAGSILTPDGLVLTNNHVVAVEGADRPYKIVAVFLKPARVSGDPHVDLARPLEAKVVARSPALDLAVLKIEKPPAPLPTIPLGDSGAVAVGDPVAAIGHPEGGGMWTLTTGAISGTKLFGSQQTFQTEASLNRGNSGGPLLDLAARQIGVNSSTMRQAPDGLAIVGVNFAVKSDQVRDWLAQQGIRLAASPATPTAPPVAASPPPTSPTPPAATPTSPAAATPTTPPVAAPPMAAPPAVAPPVAESDDLREFKGPGGELMYGRPGGRFNLDEVRREAFGKARSNAKRAFDELDQEDDKDE
jgi:serine protease Do